MFMYLATPYTSGNLSSLQFNYDRAVEAQAYLAINGHTVVSPIALHHKGALRYDIPKDYGYWQAHSQNLLRAASGLIILDIGGWDRSRGVADEIKFWLSEYHETTTDLDGDPYANMHFCDLRGNLRPFKGVNI